MNDLAIPFLAFAQLDALGFPFVVPVPSALLADVSVGYTGVMSEVVLALVGSKEYDNITRCVDMEEMEVGVVSSLLASSLLVCIESLLACSLTRSLTRSLTTGRVVSLSTLTIQLLELRNPSWKEDDVEE